MFNYTGRLKQPVSTKSYTRPAADMARQLTTAFAVAPAGHMAPLVPSQESPARSAPAISSYPTSICGCCSPKEIAETTASIYDYTDDGDDRGSSDGVIDPVKCADVLLLDDLLARCPSTCSQYTALAHHGAQAAKKKHQERGMGRR